MSRPAPMEVPQARLSSPFHTRLQMLDRLNTWQRLERLRQRRRIVLP